MDLISLAGTQSEALGNTTARKRLLVAGKSKPRGTDKSCVLHAMHSHAESILAYAATDRRPVMIPDKKPYTHVRLILHETAEGLQDRYEVRVSTFVEFDRNAGRRAISGHPDKDQALEIAQEIARKERERVGE